MRRRFAPPPHAIVDGLCLAARGVQRPSYFFP
jgi:hypothetical protein